MVAVLAACSGESPVSLTDDVSKVVWSLNMDIGATTIVVDGTQQLAAMPRTIDGVAINDPLPITYTSTDTTSVTVSPAGLVTGRAITFTPTLVVASTVAGGVTLADTTLVMVTAQSHTFKTLSIQPGPFDSTRVGVGSSTFLNLTATDSNDVPLFDLAVKYQSSNPAIAQYEFGSIRGYSRGDVKIIATSTSYGVTRADTVVYTVTNPTSAEVRILGRNTGGVTPFSPLVAIIGAGGRIVFFNVGAQTNSITFDNGRGNITGGDIPSIPRFVRQQRTFPVAGTYTYKDSIGFSGTIIVLPNE